MLSCLVIPPTMLLLGVDVDWTLLLLPLIAIPTLALAMGLGLIGAVMHTHIRDTAHVVSILTRAGFFLSGVFFGPCVTSMRRTMRPLTQPCGRPHRNVRSTMTGDTSLPDSNGLDARCWCVLLGLVLGSIVFVRREAEAVKHL